MTRRVGTFVYLGALALFLLFFLEWTSPGRCASRVPSCEMEQVVVTATRVPQAKVELPSVVDLIGGMDMERTVGEDLTDIVKKNSSVDVIQYPGMLSGIGLRGFRPEYFGITKHCLVLIDGRPAGATNLSTLLVDNVERIEVLKGPASSLYGAEAMGGVVNIITRHSTGRPSGSVDVGAGSFDTWYARAAVGGKASGPFDFDLSAGTRNQNDDITLGNGHGTRPGTTYETDYATFRLGAEPAEGWRLDLKGDYYYGGDIEAPGALFYGDSQQSQKDLRRYGADASIQGKWGSNRTRVVAYASRETSDYYNKYAYDYSTWSYVPTSPYHSYYSETRWWGCQVQNLYSLMGRHDVVAGLDYQAIEQESRSYNRDGSRRAPWSPDSRRENWSPFVETVWRFLDRRFVVTLGARYDYFEVETKATPYKTDFHPGSESFDTVSPRAGVKFRLNEVLSLHATVGKAFVPPTAAQMTGYSERDVGGTVMITRGNPGLGPETSWSWDAGMGVAWKRLGLESDLTFFVTRVDDKISTTTKGNVTTYENSSRAGMAGAELELAWDAGEAFELGRSIRLFVNGTRLFHARERLDGGGWQDIHNVAHWKVNYGLDYDDGRYSGRILARYVGKRKDYDWYSPGYPEITCDAFTVVDLSLGMTFKRHHHLSFDVGNVFDEYYYEKPEYPLAGRSWYIGYKFTF